MMDTESQVKKIESCKSIFESRDVERSETFQSRKKRDISNEIITSITLKTLFRQSSIYVLKINEI